MADGEVVPNETIVPLLPCVDADETLAFWRALGFDVTYEQRKPYLYLAFHFSGFDLHYGRAATGIVPAEEVTGGCLVLVDDVAAYHAAFVGKMRSAYGKMLVKGLPRITRYRPGASRFTVSDPNGNGIIFIRRGEARDVEYGGSKALTGLAKVLDNARTLREFKEDDKAAYRALNSGLRRHGDSATVLEQATALAMLIEVDPEHADEWGRRLSGLTLTDEEREQVESAIVEPALLKPWLS